MLKSLQYSLSLFDYKEKKIMPFLAVEIQHVD